MRIINKIVVDQLATIDDKIKAKYNYIITENGVCDMGLPLDQPPLFLKDFKGVIGVLIVGDGNVTPKQKHVLKMILRHLISQFKISKDNVVSRSEIIKNYKMNFDLKKYMIEYAI